LQIASEDWCDLIEAKYAWLSLSSKDIKKKAHDLVTRARNDAVKSKNDSLYHHTLAIAFLGTYVTGRASKSMENSIRTSVQVLIAEHYDIVGWCFPKEEREKPTPEGNFTPGVILIGQQA
jgi:hypothetical protein